MRIFLDVDDGTATNHNSSSTTTARNSFPKHILQTSRKFNPASLGLHKFGILGQKAHLADSKERFHSDEESHHQTIVASDNNNKIPSPPQSTTTKEVLLDQNGNVIQQCHSARYKIDNFTYFRRC